MKKSFLPLLVTAIVTSCGAPAEKKADETKKTDVAGLFEKYYEERLQLYPLEATAIADNRYDDQLPCDISDSYREKLKDFYQKYLDEISNVDRSTLTAQDQVSYDMFKHEMEMQIEGFKFHDNLIPF